MSRLTPTILALLTLVLTLACPAPSMAAEAPHAVTHAAEPERSVGGLDVAVGMTPAERAAEWILFRVVDAGIVMLVLSFALCLMRVARGPTLIDRGLATDTITLHVVGLAILLTIGLRTLLYFDAVLIFAILGFATTVAFAQFIGRRRAV
ncbi:MAG: hypothetical protein H6814_08735 [Phycisphaeraceae bacterium]|nr:hypothetical protein [Phycisphaeraceae bacterium]